MKLSGVGSLSLLLPYLFERNHFKHQELVFHIRIRVTDSRIRPDAGGHNKEHLEMVS
jgi:hypothetical protein